MCIWQDTMDSNLSMPDVTHVYPKFPCALVVGAKAAPSVILPRILLPDRKHRGPKAVIVSGDYVHRLCHTGIKCTQWNYTLSYSYPSEWKSVNLTFQKRAVFNSNLNNSNISNAKNIINAFNNYSWTKQGCAGDSPLCVSNCLELSQWLHQQHPKLPCLSWDVHRINAGQCELCCHLQLTLHAALRSHCTNRLPKAMCMRLLCSTRVQFWIKVYKHVSNSKQKQIGHFILATVPQTVGKHWKDFLRNNIVLLWFGTICTI